MPKIDLGLPSYDSLFSTETERQEAKQEKIISVPIDKISDFKNHPFHVSMDEDMLKLIDSIRENGILIPALVRPKGDGTYEMISGHRRKFAMSHIGLKEMKVIVRDVPVDQVVYILNMNVEFNGKIKFINGSFVETGCTGIRESVILNSLVNEYGSMDEAFKHWNFDPYDKLIKAGILMNVSECEKFDKQFPEHPLSRCRELIESIIDNN